MQEQSVTYVYTKNEIPSTLGKIIIKYVDLEGNPISEDVIMTGTIGDTYITEKKKIDNYTFKEVQGNITGEYTNETQTVTYVYAKDETKPVQKTELNNKESNSSNNQGLPETGESGTNITSIFGLAFLVAGLILPFKRIK